MSKDKTNWTKEQQVFIDVIRYQKKQIAKLKMKLAAKELGFDVSNKKLYK